MKLNQDYNYLNHIINNIKIGEIMDLGVLKIV